MDDVEAFKSAFRRLAAGVSVVTALHPDGRPAGFTATSLASLAADPADGHVQHGAQGERLAGDRADRARAHPLPRACAIARPPRPCRWMPTQRFVGDHWAPGPLGLPLLNDVPAWMLCRIIGRYPVEESAVVVVQIEDGALGEPDVPLLYHEREYWKPGDRA